MILNWVHTLMWLTPNCVRCPDDPVFIYNFAISAISRIYMFVYDVFIKCKRSNLVSPFRVSRIIAIWITRFLFFDCLLYLLDFYVKAWILAHRFRSVQIFEFMAETFSYWTKNWKIRTKPCFDLSDPESLWSWISMICGSLIVTRK